MRRAAAAASVCLLIAGCSLKADQRKATVAVAHFHALLNAGDFDRIISEADPRFEWPARGPTFRQYLAAVHRKLGYCGSWQMANFVESLGSHGRTTRLNTRIHCDKDDAQETFLLATGDPMKVRGYLITSRTLVTS